MRMGTFHVWRLCWMFLLITLIEGRTITRMATITSPSGELITKTWTTTDNGSGDNGGTPLEQQIWPSGMDPSVIRELLETKQPVVRTEQEANGRVRTTTYTLGPNNSISKKTVTQWRTQSTPLAQPVPLDLLSRFGPDAPATPPHNRTLSNGNKLWPDIEEAYEQRSPPKEQTTPTVWNIDDGLLEAPSVTPASAPSTTRPTRPKNAVEIQTTTPLPTLEDFLRQQYDSTSKERTVPKPRGSTTQTVIFNKEPTAPSPAKRTDEKPVRRINVDELPLMAVLPSAPAGTDHNHNVVPSELRPVVSSQRPLHAFHIDNIPNTGLSESFFTDTQPNVETNVKSYTKTIHTGALPTANDLDPKMQDILRRAGISPDDIRAANGEAITKTRIEPDGRVIKTTYRVRTSPSGPAVPTRGSFERVDRPDLLTSGSTHVYRQSSESSPPNTHAVHPLLNFPSRFPTGNPINDFLAKIGLTAEDLYAKSGQYTKTILDTNGRILTATFVLSTVKAGDESADAKLAKPLK